MASRKHYRQLAEAVGRHLGHWHTPVSNDKASHGVKTEWCVDDTDKARVDYMVTLTMRDAQRLMTDLCDILESDNQSFDRGRFLAAVIHEVGLWYTSIYEARRVHELSHAVAEVVATTTYPNSVVNRSIAAAICSDEGGQQ